MTTTHSTVIVTGASGALGAATARQLARWGANVVITGRRADALETVAEGIRADGGRVHVIAGDLTQAETVGALVEGTLAQFGAIDALVNNAGVLAIETLADGSLETWRWVFEVNVVSVLALTQSALPYLRERRGRVVNVSSGAGVKGYEAWGAYGASKAAMNHLTMTLANEEPHIAPIAVRPGVVDTAMQAQIREQGGGIMPPQNHARFVGLHRDGDLIPPERPAASLAALALDMPDALRGQFVSWNDAPLLTLVNARL